MPAFYSDTALSLCTMISMLRSELGYAVRIRVQIFASYFFHCTYGGTSITTLRIMTFSIMTLSITGLYVTLSKYNIEHNWHCSSELNNAVQYAECGCAECRILFNVIPRDIILNVIIMSVIMLSVVAPIWSSMLFDCQFSRGRHWKVLQCIMPLKSIQNKTLLF